LLALPFLSPIKPSGPTWVRLTSKPPAYVAQNYLQHTATPSVPHLALCTSRLQVCLKSALRTDTRCHFFGTSENDTYGLADAATPYVLWDNPFYSQSTLTTVSRPGHRHTALKITIVCG
jgi:hypothetical protein